jgi:hypothetical protein
MRVDRQRIKDFGFARTKSGALFLMTPDDFKLCHFLQYVVYVNIKLVRGEFLDGFISKNESANSIARLRHKKATEKKVAEFATKIGIHHYSYVYDLSIWPHIVGMKRTYGWLKRYSVSVTASSPIYIYEIDLRKWYTNCLFVVEEDYREKNKPVNIFDARFLSELKKQRDLPS